MFETIFLLLILEMLQSDHSQAGVYNNKFQSERSRHITSRIQIKATMFRCPNKHGYNCFHKGFGSKINTSNICVGFDNDEPVLYSGVTDCRRKMVVTIKFSTSRQTFTEEEYIVIDHVYEPLLKKTFKLLSPIAIRMKQDDVKQAYGLIKQHIVNAYAKEEIINKGNSNFFGCYASSKHATCGISTYNGRTVPFSEGFCCSCDTYVNVKRQPQVYQFPVQPSGSTSFSVSEFPQGIETREVLVKDKKSHIVKKRTFIYNDSNYNFEQSIQATIARLFIKCRETIFTKHIMQILKERRNNESGTQKIYSYSSNRSQQTNRMNNFNPRLYNAENKGQENGTIKTRIGKYSVIPLFPEKYSCPAFEKVKEYQKHNDDTTDPWQISEKSETIKVNEIIFNPAEGETHAHNVTVPVKVGKTQNCESILIDPNSLAYREPTIRHSIKESQSKENVSNNCMFSNVDNLKENEINLLHPNKFTNNHINLLVPKDTFHKGSISYDDVKVINSLMLKRKKNDQFKHVGKRQVTPNANQIRGGQSCMDRFVPNYADAYTYHESAHCLRFSDLWYNVYKLRRPFILHNLKLHVFVKQTMEDGITHWIDKTNGVKAKIGTLLRQAQNRESDIVFTYTPLSEIPLNEFCLDHKITTLLTPRPTTDNVKAYYPQTNEGPGKFLVVKPEDITYDGETCDKIGVGYSAFAKQANRCSKPKGSCLANQPLHLWQYDTMMQKNGLKGKYFLENYASMPTESFKEGKNESEYIMFNFGGFYRSIVNIEINMDQNSIVKKEASAQISEIYIDSSCIKDINMTILITNTGLSSFAFQVKLNDCPDVLPTTWTSKVSPLVYIPPMKSHTYHLSLYGPLKYARFHCSVDVLNSNGDLVSSRRVRIQQFDRCICMWHCLCACGASRNGLKCIPMSLNHYHAAGFIGSLPIDFVGDDESVKHNNKTWFAMQHLLMFILFHHVVALSLGILKVLFGIIFPVIGNYGLWIISSNNVKSLLKYKDKEIVGLPIQHDYCGFPLYPGTQSRNLRFANWRKHTMLNILFFLIAPGVALVMILEMLYNKLGCKKNQPYPSSIDVYKYSVEQETMQIALAENINTPLFQQKVQEFGRMNLNAKVFDEERGPIITQTDNINTPSSQQKVQEFDRMNLNARASDTEKVTLITQSEIINTSSSQQNGQEFESINLLERAMPGEITIWNTFIVYRILSKPIPDIYNSQETLYSIEGHLRSHNGIHEFTVCPPLKLYWRVEDNKPIIPPKLLESNFFNRKYYSLRDVINARELSTQPVGVIINSKRDYYKNTLDEIWTSDNNIFPRKKSSKCIYYNRNMFSNSNETYSYDVHSVESHSKKLCTNSNATYSISQNSIIRTSDNLKENRLNCIKYNESAISLDDDTESYSCNRKESRLFDLKTNPSFTGNINTFSNCTYTISESAIRKYSSNDPIMSKSNSRNLFSRRKKHVNDSKITIWSFDSKSTSTLFTQNESSRDSFTGGNYLDPSEQFIYSSRFPVMRSEPSNFMRRKIRTKKVQKYKSYNRSRAKTWAITCLKYLRHQKHREETQYTTLTTNNYYTSSHDTDIVKYLLLKENEDNSDSISYE